jgi:hypothetical protein
MSELLTAGSAMFELLSNAATDPADAIGAGSEGLRRIPRCRCDDVTSRLGDSGGDGQELLFGSGFFGPGRESHVGGVGRVCSGHRGCGGC